MKILIAEDDPVMLKTIGLRLKKDGHDVMSTADGREALQQIETFQPDLVITDIMMPYSSGLDIITATRQKTAKKIPVIILTAMGQEDMVLQAFRLGADDYITKPFNPNELSIRIKRLAN